MNAPAPVDTDLFDNPLGTDGFEFVEFTSPEPERLKGLFELIVQRDRAIEQTRSGAAGAVLARGGTGSFDHAGILGETEIIVRPDHDLTLAFADHMITQALFDAAEVRVKSLCPGIC